MSINENERFAEVKKNILINAPIGKSLGICCYS